jgi:hypothetical protein
MGNAVPKLRDAAWPAGLLKRPGIFTRKLSCRSVFIIDLLKVKNTENFMVLYFSASVKSACPAAGGRQGSLRFKF